MISLSLCLWNDMASLAENNSSKGRGVQVFDPCADVFEVYAN